LGKLLLLLLWFLLLVFVLLIQVFRVVFIATSVAGRVGELAAAFRERVNVIAAGRRSSTPCQVMSPGLSSVIIHGPVIKLSTCIYKFENQLVGNIKHTMLNYPHSPSLKSYIWYKTPFKDRQNYS